MVRQNIEAKSQVAPLMTDWRWRWEEPNRDKIHPPNRCPQRPASSSEALLLNLYQLPIIPSNYECMDGLIYRLGQSPHEPIVSPKLDY